MAAKEMSELTPSESLMIEVLIARLRFGEVCWTFGSSQRAIANRLESKGYIWTKGGIVEGSFRAFPTNEMIATFLSYDYDAPIFRDAHPRKAFKRIQKNAKKLRSKSQQ